MTESPSRSVRAVARVSVGTAPTAPATITPRRRPGHLGPVHVLQLLVAEASVLGLLAVLGQHIVVLVSVGLVGLVILVTVLARQQGRWWIERRILTRHFRRRARTGVEAHPRDARLAVLRTLAPRLTVEEIPVSDDSLIGVARDGAGWFAVAESSAKAAMADEPAAAIPLALLVTALTETGQPGAALQVVTHTVGAPSLDLKPALPVAYSYRELLQRFGPVPIPVDRTTWVAVRLDARALAEAGVESAEQAPIITATLLRRLVKTSHRAGVGIRPLDRDGLLSALERSCDLQRPDEAAPIPQPREAWESWHSGGLSHRSFWVQDWPSVAEAGALVDWLSTAPASLTSVAFVVVPDAAPGADADLRCLVRVAAPADQLATVCEAVDRGAQLAHAQLFALDGEQGPAVYATAPTGGGPR